MRASFSDLFRSLTDREIDFAQQMLRVLVRLQIEAPETIETSVQQQAALRNDAVWYSGGTNFADGSDHGDDQEHVHFHRAERVTLGLFEDMIHGGGCGEEGCCGPAAVGFNGWRPAISYVHQIKAQRQASPLGEGDGYRAVPGCDSSPCGSRVGPSIHPCLFQAAD